MTKLLNRAKMAVTGTPGTGAATMGAAQPGFQTLTAAGAVTGDKIPGLWESGSDWEIGYSQWDATAGTLTRVSTTASSNAGAAISLTSAATFTATALVADILSNSTRQVFTATAGQTTFAVTNGYFAPYIDVYQNGVKLVSGVDVTVTSGTNVVLASGAQAGDTVEVVAYNVFVQSNMVQKTGDTMSGALTVPDLLIGSDHVSAFCGMKNRFINGAMEISQRGSSGVAPVSVQYAVDRWFTNFAGAAGTWGQATGLSIGSLGFPIGFYVTGAAGNTGINQGQRIEANNLRDLASRTVTLSGWLFSTAAVTPVLGVYLPSAFNDYSAGGYQGGVPALPAIPANIWTFFSVSFVLGANAANGGQFEIQWGATGAGVTRYMTGMQLEVGGIPTTFERRPYAYDEALCFRYYCRQQCEIQGGSSGVSYLQRVNFKQRMRATPTVGTISTGTQTNATVTNAAGNLTTDGFYFQITTSGTNGFVIGYVSDFNAEL